MAYNIENARGLIGLLVVVLIAWLFSENRRRFPVWMTIGAILIQAAFVLLLFALPNAQAALDGVNAAVNGLAEASDRGAQFVFGYLSGGEQPYQRFPEEAPDAFIFGFRVLPLILVISALSALLWHWGILRVITQAFGFVFEKTMRIGGASALAAAVNIFVGMVESPIVIRAYLDKLTRSELFMMMVVGLATVAGSTMVAYAVMLQGVLPNAAGHVLVASIISAPAGILLSRIMIPEDGPATKHDLTTDLKYESSMDAITKGVADGVMVAVNVAAFLIVFVAFVWLVNGLLPVIAEPLADWLNPHLAADMQIIPERATLQTLFGYAFAPVAWLIGVPWAEAQSAGGVLGVKLFLTEFIAFIDLSQIPAEAMSDRSRMIVTYAICGFANIASIGIMTGGMTALMPNRRSEILGLAWKALLPGFMATLMTASIVSALPESIFAR